MVMDFTCCMLISCYEVKPSKSKRFVAKYEKTDTNLCVIMHITVDLLNFLLLQFPTFPKIILFTAV